MANCRRHSHFFRIPQMINELARTKSLPATKSECLGSCLLLSRIFAVLLMSFWSALDSAAEENARLSIKVVDEKDDITPVRAWIDVDGMRFFKPSLPENVTVYDRDRSFSCDGEFTIEVPAGNSVVHRRNRRRRNDRENDPTETLDRYACRGLVFS